jgi:hypothetical protein
MRVPGILIIALVLLLCVLATGCTTDIADGLLSTPTPAPTPPPATVHVTKPPTLPVTVPITVPTPEPVQALPSERQVNLVLTKDRPTSEIHLQYQGGPGELFLTRVMLRLHAPDTGYTEYIMDNGKQPETGDEIIVQGTRGGDWCEVFVISAGTRYKVMNESVYGGMYY